MGVGNRVYFRPSSHIETYTKSYFFQHHFKIDNEYTGNKYLIKSCNEDSKLNLRLFHEHLRRPRQKLSYNKLFPNVIILFGFRLGFDSPVKKNLAKDIFEKSF